MTTSAFDAAAADFTALGEYLWGPIGVATVAAAGLRPGERVLDACCGTGASAIPAAEAVGADGLVDAVDLSGPMVDELRGLSAGLPQLRAHQADVTTWDTGGYDVVQSALGIFFFPDMTAGTEHLISRAGRVVFTIWRGDAMAAAGRHLGLAVAAATGTAPPKERERSLFDRINQPGTYAAWLTERGLTEVAVTTHDMRLTMTPEVAWLVVTGSGYRGALAKLDPGTVDTVREHYLASLRADGVTELDATTLIGTGTTAT
ncbi:class I SAM-dependent methyltransferase [Actinophytocola algeriensis]|uniref:SAM-dependent methyltransferase n=1 Tax=Actinophytocola algeriensis TaxID=1768010 RepID=A0A7W7QDV1_9PSEU|nr:class I SAM-dependent methyltransferase [Actinophytocola algeriensis]MBB4911709.1 SAM-dependent methyltransferase [Actinophytocola algeriensis]MBE1473303.1 SAM-dependent methyltransferase [Actinophytocola algeriensis]